MANGISNASKCKYIVMKCNKPIDMRGVINFHFANDLKAPTAIVFALSLM